MYVYCVYVCMYVYCVQWRIQDFPEEGAPTRGGGRQDTILFKFPENCMKLKKIRPPGGARVPCAHLRSATGVYVCMYVYCVYVCVYVYCVYVVCMYVYCVYVCVYVYCVYVCMYTVCMYVCMYTVCMYVCMYVYCVYVCVYVYCVYVCVYVYCVYVFSMYVLYTDGTD